LKTINFGHKQHPRIGSVNTLELCTLFLNVANVMASFYIVNKEAYRGQHLKIGKNIEMK
jgi:hypothetical protein